MDKKTWRYNNTLLRESDEYMTRKELADRLGLDYEFCKKVEAAEPGQSFITFMEDVDPSVKWEEDWYDEGFPEMKGNYLFDHFDNMWLYGAFANKFGDEIPKKYVEADGLNPYYMQLDPEFLRVEDIYEDILELAEVTAEDDEEW